MIISRDSLSDRIKLCPIVCSPASISMPKPILCSVELLPSERKLWVLTTLISPNGSTGVLCR